MDNSKNYSILFKQITNLEIEVSDLENQLYSARLENEALKNKINDYHNAVDSLQTRLAEVRYVADIRNEMNYDVPLVRQ